MMKLRKRGDMNIGKSDRTLGKHVLLDKILGREVAVALNLTHMCSEFVIVDLCAGDGRPTDQSKTCSPDIIMKHKHYLDVMVDTNGQRLPCDVLLFEKNIAAYDELRNKYLCHNIDSRTLDFIAGTNKNTFVFLHADPNLITDWPISNKLLNNCPKHTTLLATLGCNVGGLKRLPFDKRMEWFDKMYDVLRHLPKNHDAVIAALRGDKAQWAYLVTGPSKWHDEGRYEKDILKAFEYWDGGVDVVRFKTSKYEFMEQVDGLFLTKKEIDDYGLEQTYSRSH